jgi:hypothetical protein
MILNYPIHEIKLKRKPGGQLVLIDQNTEIIMSDKWLII